MRDRIHEYTIELIESVKELNTHYWEQCEPRANELSFEISDVVTRSRILEREIDLKSEGGKDK